jgi:hypothetical protein
VYDGTVHVMDVGGAGPMTTAESRLHFRSGNLIATVAADLFDPGRDIDARRSGPPLEARQRNREVTLALGRAVLANLAAAGAARRGRRAVPVRQGHAVASLTALPGVRECPALVLST